ncbi:RuBisCO large subunit C-terminal-like domain-containing protein [Nitrospira sp. Nam80]
MIGLAFQHDAAYAGRMPAPNESARVMADYQVPGSEKEARAKAALICIDQTVEASEEVLTHDLRERIVGRIEQFRRASAGRYEITISYAGDLIGHDCAGLLNVLFGTSSLRAGVRLLSFHLADALLSRWQGPRFGLQGLREASGVRDRALVCAVLKPLGRSPRELADLAYQFALGGVDLIKDDQGLMDHPFCPFDERIGRCADAIAKGAEERGRPCLYFPHVSGPLDQMRRRAQRALQAGAGGLLVAAGLTGFDALRTLAEEHTLSLPIMNHPALLGSYAVNPDSGIAPAALYGQLPRLAGADISIYPGYSTGYAMMKEDCVAIAAACRSPWHRFRPMFPTAAGRIGFEQVAELGPFYGRDVVFILGSRIQQDSRGLIAATQRFVKDVERCSMA